MQRTFSTIVTFMLACQPAPTSPVPSAPAPAPASRAPAPAVLDPAARDAFLTTVGKGELAEVERMLEGEPALAAARTETGKSAVKVALSRLRPDKQGFYAPPSNLFLRAVLARHPALDLFETAALGDAAALDRMLAADPSLVGRAWQNGWTLLHFAAFGGNAAAVRVLLDRGAALEQVAANKFGNTPLHVALLTGDRATTQVLLERGANIAATYEGGTTVLHLAAELGRVDLIELLLGRGAAINARTEDGTTALAIAVRLGRSEAVELLRRRGAI